jgi:hypothetical protein
MKTEGSRGTSAIMVFDQELVLLESPGSPAEATIGSGAAADMLLLGAADGETGAGAGAERSPPELLRAINFPVRWSTMNMYPEAAIN